MSPLFLCLIYSVAITLRVLSSVLKFLQLSFKLFELHLISFDLVPHLLHHLVGRFLHKLLVLEFLLISLEFAGQSFYLTQYFFAFLLWVNLHVHH